MQTNRKFLRPKEVEDVYGISVSRLYSMFKQGLPSVVLGKRKGGRGTRLIEVAKLDSYLREREVAG